MNKTDAKILILEDNVIIAENLLENLVELGYQHVFTARNESELIEVLDHQELDLIFSDIDLGPKSLNGLELLEKHKLHKTCIVILLTSYADEEYQKTARSLGVFSYLMKPINQKQIDVTVAMALADQVEKEIRDTLLNAPRCKFLKGTDHIFIKNKGKYEKVSFANIVYVEASGSYTLIMTVGKKYMVVSTLKAFIEFMNNPDMIRVHRQYAINYARIIAFDDQKVRLDKGDGDIELPLSRGLKKNLLEVVNKI